MGLSCIKNLKEVMHWVRKKLRGGGQLDIPDLIVPSINLLIREMAAAKERDAHMHTQRFIILINL
jgi:hypothetical protein